MSITIKKSSAFNNIQFELIYRGHQLSFKPIGFDVLALNIQPQFEKDAPEIIKEAINAGKFKGEMREVDVLIGDALKLVREHIEINTRVFCFLTDFKYGTLHDILSGDDVDLYNSLVGSEAFMQHLKTHFNKDSWDIRNAGPSLRESITECMVGFTNWFSKNPSRALSVILKQGNFGKIETRLNKLHKTPDYLVKSIVDNIPESVFKDPSSTFYDPFMGTGTFIISIVNRLMKYHGVEHIFENMIYGNDINPTATTLVKIHLKALQTQYNCANIRLNISTKNFLIGADMRKFTVIVGNPPYQKTDSVSTSIWPDFVNKCLDMVVPGGYIAMVHPSLWRAPENPLFKKMVHDRQMHTLTINNDKEGSRVFNAKTRFDYYLIENIPAYKETVVQEESGNKITVDLRKHQFLVNDAIKIIEKIIGVDCDRVKVQYNSQFHTQNTQRLNDDATRPFKYLHSYTETKGSRVLYSNDKQDNIDSKKVIYSFGRYLTPFFDTKGEYGTTQYSASILVDSDIQGNNLVTLLNSNVIKFIIKSTKWSNAMIKQNLVGLLPWIGKDNTTLITEDDINQICGLTADELNTIQEILQQK